MDKIVALVPQQIFGGFKTYADSLKKIAKNNRFHYKKIILLRPKTAEDYYKNISFRNNFVPNPLIKYLFLFKIFVRSFFILKNEDPSLIVGVGMLSNAVAFFYTVIHNLFNKKKVRLLTSVHNTFYRNGKYNRPNPSIVYSNFYYLMKIILGKSDRCICVSKGLESEVIKIFNLKNTVSIYNGVDIKKVLDASKSYVFNQKNKNSLLHILNDRKIIKISTIARLTTQKDIKTAIKAFQMVNKKFPKTVLLIIGVGPKYENLNKLVNAYNLSRKIYFIGATKNPYYFLKRTNIYIHSAIYEGFGYSIIEAMSLGKPVVATDSPYGPREILAEGKYGLLTRIRSAKEMSAAITKLIINKKLFQSYSLLSKKRAQDFSIDKMSSAYTQLIKSLGSFPN